MGTGKILGILIFELLHDEFGARVPGILLFVILFELFAHIKCTPSESNAECICHSRLMWHVTM
jgi:hypothetical protein